MLAPEVELCLPRLLRLARCRASGDCGPSAGVLAAGPVIGTLLLHAAFAHVSLAISLDPPRCRRAVPRPRRRPVRGGHLAVRHDSPATIHSQESSAGSPSKPSARRAAADSPVPAPALCPPLLLPPPPGASPPFSLSSG